LALEHKSLESFERERERKRREKEEKGKALKERD